MCNHFVNQWLQVSPNLYESAMIVLWFVFSIIALEAVTSVPGWVSHFVQGVGRGAFFRYVIVNLYYVFKIKAKLCYLYKKKTSVCMCVCVCVCVCVLLRHL